MTKESKDKASKLPLTFKAEAGRPENAISPLGSELGSGRTEVEIRHNLNPQVQGMENAKSVFHNLGIERSVVSSQPLVTGSQPTASQKPITNNQQPTTNLTAQDILSKSEEELKELIPERTRETHNLLKSMKIMTAIMLGKDKNKELAQMLQTDKSFTSKQINELEEQGLVKREGEGRDTKYVVDAFNLMKFLQTKVIIKWTKKEEEKKEETKRDGG